MPNEKMKTAFTPFFRRLHAACCVYYTNKWFWCALVSIVFMSINGIIIQGLFANKSTVNTRLQIQRHEKHIADTLKPDNSKTKKIRFQYKQDEIKFREFHERHLEIVLNHQRNPFLFQLAITLFVLTLGAGSFFPSQLRNQFSNPRSIITPGFTLPHLVAGIGSMILLAGLGSGFVWYWTGASFISCFCLVLFGSGNLIHANKKKKTEKVIFYLLVPAGVIGLLFFRFPVLLDYMEGQYLFVAVVLGLIGLTFITLFARRLMHFDVEQPEYSPLGLTVNYNDIYTQPDFQKQGWHLRAMDWLSQYFQYRALRNNNLNRTLLWQVPRGGLAILYIGYVIVLMTISGLGLFLIERDIGSLNGIFQLRNTAIPLFLMTPLSGLFLFFVVVTWVQMRPQIQMELLRPMSRTGFVRSLIRTHLLETSLVAVPVFAGNVVLTIMFYSETDYILSNIILMFLISLLLICTIPWLISFQSLSSVLFIMMIVQVMVIALIDPPPSPLRESIFLFWVAHGLIFIGVIIVGILMLLDTKRRWMKTEFGR